MKRYYEKVIERLKQEFNIEKFWGQTVFKISRRGFLYFRYSKRHEGDKYFFGVETDVINQIKNSLYSILFICGDENSVVVIPSDIFERIIEGIKTSGNQWKINIFFTKDERVELKVSGKERIDVTKYLNNTDFILSKVYLIKQKIPSKEIDYDLIKRKLELKKDEKEVEIELLKNKLVQYASLSEQPKKFEEIIEKIFVEFGFECKKIGKSGDTDVLAKSNYSVIIEAKSTKRRSISRINFTRLKQHKIKHNADFIIVIAKDFEPAVIRDSEIEKAHLFPIETILGLLEISKNFPIYPNLLFPLLEKKTGIVKKEDLGYIETMYKEQKLLREGLYLLIEILSNEKPKTADEIKGVVNTKLEEKYKVKDFFDRNEIEKILSLLQIKSLNLVAKRKDSYVRLLDAKNSKKILSFFFNSMKK